MSGNTPLPASLVPVAPSTAILPTDVPEAQAISLILDKLKELKILKATYAQDTQLKDAKINELEARIASLLSELETAQVALASANQEIVTLRASLQKAGQRLLDQSAPFGSTEGDEVAIPQSLVDRADISGPTDDSMGPVTEILLTDLEMVADHSDSAEESAVDDGDFDGPPSVTVRGPDRLPGMTARPRTT